MKLKIKNQKHTRWNRFLRYINNYKILKCETSFKWSFLKYFIQISLLNVYDLTRLESNKILLGIMLVKKYRHENYIDIKKLIIPHDKNFENTDVLRQLRTYINNYRPLGYTYAEITFPLYLKRQLNFFLNELNFEENTEKKLTHLINNTDENQTTLVTAENEH